MTDLRKAAQAALSALDDARHHMSAAGVFTEIQLAAQDALRAALDAQPQQSSAYHPAYLLGFADGAAQYARMTRDLITEPAAQQAAPTATVKESLTLRSAPTPATVLSDAEIENIAVAEEIGGVGRGDDDGYSIHVFDAESIENFGRAVERAVLEKLRGGA